jgi:hypothetical protein
MKTLKQSTSYIFKPLLGSSKTNNPTTPLAYGLKSNAVKHSTAAGMPTDK